MTKHEIWQREVAKEINKNFIIRWKCHNGIEWSQENLIGAAQVIKVLEWEHTYKMFMKAYNSGYQIHAFRFRRGLEFTFVSR